MPKQQIPGVVYKEITQDDLKDPNLAALNELLRQLSIVANVIVGTHGPIPLTVDLDMQNGNLKNINAATVGKLIAGGAAPVASPGQLGLGSGVAAVATPGAATLPVNPVGFLVFSLGGIQIKIPYYNP